MKPNQQIYLRLSIPSPMTSLILLLGHVYFQDNTLVGIKGRISIHLHISYMPTGKDETNRHASTSLEWVQCSYFQTVINWQKTSFSSSQMLLHKVFSYIRVIMDLIACYSMRRLSHLEICFIR